MHFVFILNFYITNLSEPAEAVNPQKDLPNNERANGEEFEVGVQEISFPEGLQLASSTDVKPLETLKIEILIILLCCCATSRNLSII
jgi:hypothetical protein